MNLGLHDSGQFAQMPEGRIELRPVIGMGVAGYQLADARHHGTQFRKMANGLMRPLGQLDHFFAVEQPFDEAVQFLETNHTVSAHICGGRLRGV